jgi:hypothetical protein
MSIPPWQVLEASTPAWQHDALAFTFQRCSGVRTPSQEGVELDAMYSDLFALSFVIIVRVIATGTSEDRGFGNRRILACMNCLNCGKAVLGQKDLPQIMLKHCWGMRAVSARNTVSTSVARSFWSFSWSDFFSVRSPCSVSSNMPLYVWYQPLRAP